MNKKVSIELSDETHLQAEKQAQERGFESVAAYLDALVQQDVDPTTGLDPDWLEEQIEEGLASGDAGPLTRETLHQLVSEGIERAKRRT